MKTLWIPIVVVLSLMTLAGCRNTEHRNEEALDETVKLLPWYSDFIKFCRVVEDEESNSAERKKAINGSRAFLIKLRKTTGQGVVKSAYIGNAGRTASLDVQAGYVRLITDSGKEHKKGSKIYDVIATLNDGDCVRFETKAVRVSSDRTQDLNTTCEEMFYTTFTKVERCP